MVEGCFKKHFGSSKQPSQSLVPIPKYLKPARTTTRTAVWVGRKHMVWYIDSLIFKLLPSSACSDYFKLRPKTFQNNDKCHLLSPVKTVIENS